MLAALTFGCVSTPRCQLADFLNSFIMKFEKRLLQTPPQQQFPAYRRKPANFCRTSSSGVSLSHLLRLRTSGQNARPSLICRCVAESCSKVMANGRRQNGRFDKPQK